MKTASIVLDRPVQSAPLSSIAHDPRLGSVHVSLYAALSYYFGKSNGNPFQISRKKLMGYSRIRSTATYHKCVRELARYGYIIYEPSYHPRNGSRIWLTVSSGCGQPGESDGEKYPD